MKANWKNGVCGLVGGLLGALAMHGFRLLWDSRAAAGPESGIYGFDEEADINSVDQVCSLLSLPPVSKQEALKTALLLHYAYGALAGGAYGLARLKIPAVRAGSGLLFGAALWLVGDEFAITVSGLSKPATRKPSSHLSALFAHLLFGLALETSRRTINRLVS